MKKAVLITGAAGGIGTALTEAYAEKGWTVIATSRTKPAEMAHIESFIPCDLIKLAHSDKTRDVFASLVRDQLDKSGALLKAIVNNAAMQVLGPTEALSTDQWKNSFAVNVLAPFRLVQSFLPNLEAQQGSVVNIGTVHAQATKAEFVIYATTKTAMHGLTRSLAVDLGGRIRVNCLAPAATETDMLKAGFEGRKEAYQALAAAHPIGRIAAPAEVAKTCIFLSSDEASFITGAILYCDGGVLSRLHDPA